MKIIYQQHISWFETEMALESIESVYEATKYTSLPVELHFCFNTQTYLESPIEGTTKEMFDILLSHPKSSEWKVTWKTDYDQFYNVGDWRRDCYDSDNFTVWGESDCLVPTPYFKYLELSFEQLTPPFVLTIQQKKMWDETWTPVEYTPLQSFTIEQVREASNKLVTGEGTMTLEELNNVNLQHLDKVKLRQSGHYKGDGALVCLSPNLPKDFLPQGLHMCGEDTHFFNYCNLEKIPLFMLDYLMKGHNTGHPKKRMNYQKSTEQQERFDHLNTSMRELSYKVLTQ